MHMYANDATLRVGVSSVRPLLPDLLAFVARTGFPAEKVTTLLADWEDAPTAYATRTTKLVLHRPPLPPSDVRGRPRRVVRSRPDNDRSWPGFGR